MFSPHLVQQAHSLLRSLEAKNATLTTAESCTGGLMAGLITAIPGSSAVFERGLVTYSNAAKSDLLGIPAEMIYKHGAVSVEVAEAMATGALKAGDADYSIAVTGIAGPGGGSKEKPVGLVYIGVARKSPKQIPEEIPKQIPKQIRVKKFQFDGDRSAVRRQTIAEAIQMILNLI